MATTPRRYYEPPANDPPITDSGQHSQAWTEHFQTMADNAADLWEQMEALATLGTVGIVDGSDAAPGIVGEYMTATGAAVIPTTDILTNLASLALTPGDWDVTGSVFYQADVGAHDYFAVGIDTVDARNAATFPTTAFNQIMPTTMHRLNITTPTTVWVVAQAGFAGLMMATGTINARRAR